MLKAGWTTTRSRELDRHTLGRLTTTISVQLRGLGACPECGYAPEAMANACIDVATQVGTLTCTLPCQSGDGASLRRQPDAAQAAATVDAPSQSGEGESAINLEMAQAAPPQVSTHGGAPPQTKGFAAATAEATGQNKRSINQQLARAEALGDDAMAKLNGTSLDSGVELDALIKLPEAVPTTVRFKNSNSACARAKSAKCANFGHGGLLLGGIN